MARAENTRAPSPSDRIWSRLFRAGPFYTRGPATARWPRVVAFVDCVARGARSAVEPRGAERVVRCTRGAGAGRALCTLSRSLILTYTYH